MDKNEFLDILSRQLSGHLPEGTVAAHVQYYRNYIDEQKQQGRSESDILTELGDPRLIARTILDTASAEDTVTPDAAYDGSDPASSTHVRRHTYKIDFSTWYGKLIAILGAAFVIFLLCTILSVLIPVVLIAGAVMYLISYFKKHR